MQLNFVDLQFRFWNSEGNNRCISVYLLNPMPELHKAFHWESSESSAYSNRIRYYVEGTTALELCHCHNLKENALYLYNKIEGCKSFELSAEREYITASFLGWLPCISCIHSILVHLMFLAEELLITKARHLPGFKRGKIFTYKFPSTYL